MTTTTTGSRPGQTEGAPAPRERLAPPPKLRRRPGLIAASIAAVCLGALISVWAYTSSTETRSVLAVRETVHRGEVISAADLVTVNISVDPALSPVLATQAEQVVGSRAVYDLPAGAVVTTGSVADVVVPRAGKSMVGVSLSPAMMPAAELRPGDRVRVVTTPGAQGEITPEEPTTLAGDVVAVQVSPDGTGATIVNLEVDEGDAARLAAYAATGKVAIVLDSREH